MTATKKEQAWINRLQKLMDKAPKSLWLFSNGTMYVLKKGANGKQVFKRDFTVDQDYVITSISGITSEGGDW